MELYIRETQEILRRFITRKLTFPECISALDAALAALIPELKPNEILGLRAVMLANNEIVMKEMAKRERKRKTDSKANAKAKVAAKNRHASN